MMLPFAPAADAANDALLDDVASDYERELVNDWGRNR